jgi:coatomer subunit beta'
VTFHPELSIILSGSEDATVKLWHSDTYSLESTLNFGLGRCWTISSLKGSNNIAVGYDQGTFMVKVKNKISRTKRQTIQFHCFSWIKKN